MQRYSIFPRGLFICLGCLLVCSVPDVAIGQTQQQEPFEQLQQQIITVRNEFKQWIQRSEKDREAIQEYVEEHLEELLSEHEDSQPYYPELQEHVERVHSTIENYSAGIDALEQSVATFESTMNEQLDQIEATLADIKIRGLPKPHREREPVAPPPVSDEGVEAPLEELPPPLEIPPGQLFRAAYKFYMESDYDTAIAGFQKYLFDYPDTQLTGAAQYWIAESLSKLEEYDIAIEEYDRLIASYPQSEKLPDAYYGKAMALLKVGQPADAKVLFQYVLDHFRGTIAAKKAENRLQELP